jgi:hypothetical protein
MRKEDAYGVEGLREDLSAAEEHLLELESKFETERSLDHSNEEILRALMEDIKKVKKDISLKKELIMILGDEEFNPEHGDIFDRFLKLEGEPFEDEIIRVRYPLRGVGLALLMEIRERYYKFKEGKQNKE